MRAAAPRFFTKEHYEAQSGTAPPLLCELVVHCLELVSRLAEAGLDFRFKGGNSLLLLLEDPQRFSIDVDVVTTEPRERLIAIVEEIASAGGAFTSCEVRAHKTKPWLPMISFRLFFPSVYQPPAEAFVMLDCVLEAAPYPGIRRPVRCLGIYQSDAEVEVPSIDGLIADKLLTLGPATLGIPLGKGKEAHRLKHVFDVALLARQPHDGSAVRRWLEACLDQENSLQRKALTPQEVALDTRAFLDAPLACAECPDPAASAATDYIHETAKGFTEFREHLFRRRYSWDDFREDCRLVLRTLGEAGL